MPTRRLILPTRYAVLGNVRDNRIAQIDLDGSEAEYEIFTRRIGRTDMLVLQRDDGTEIGVIDSRSKAIDALPELLRCKNFSEVVLGRDSTLKGAWITPVPIDPAIADLREISAKQAAIRSSWSGFQIVEEQRANDRIIRAGLRPPQIGALYSVLGHWRMSTGVATVVMPTGTGKTETMLALLAAEQLNRLLVIVPSNALRIQIGTKFATMGQLSSIGAMPKASKFPIVGTLSHELTTREEVEDVFSRCNVVVTTMAVAGQCSEQVQARIAELCSHLFVDEAHHIAARTWAAFRDRFAGKRIVQFTATPFRNDGKHIEGRAVFSYPLRKAQEDGYFKKIKFLPVEEFDRNEADVAIADLAVAQLRADGVAGFAHVVMARCEDINRAIQLHELYRAKAPDLNPRIVHSGMPKAEAKAALADVRSGISKIIVCVSMLGEGFDMPELKIAAIHQFHKSLAPTLQFTGRFTRSRNDLGDATMIANIADQNISDSLRALYAEDADWNILIQERADEETSSYAERAELHEGFGDISELLSLRNIAPKASAVVFKTHCANWAPARVDDGLKTGGWIEIYAGPFINEAKKLALVVTRERELIEWGDIRDLTNASWHLYVLYWDEDHDLLYINSSNKASTHDELAKAVCGADVEVIKGEPIFRSLHGLDALVVKNLGLTDLINQNLRHSQLMGFDVSDQLPEAVRLNKKKTNIFGRGYEDGRMVSIGCSLKGRVWSISGATDLLTWMRWCRHMGAKLTNDTLTTAGVLQHVVLPKRVAERPANIVPLFVDWPLEFLEKPEDKIMVYIDDRAAPFFEAELKIIDHAENGPIRFQIGIDDRVARFEIICGAAGCSFNALAGVRATIKVVKTERTVKEWFDKLQPAIRFANGSYLEGNELYELTGVNRAVYDRAQIIPWNWDGTDITVESQTAEKLENSIQRKVINWILASEPVPDIVFDDDGSGESADIVCITTGESIRVDLYHCKYSSTPVPSGRLSDLYEVCGQAQRSVRWRQSFEELIQHLRLRELKRSNAGRHGRPVVSRFERGNIDLLLKTLKASRRAPVEFRVVMVQPGLSVAAAQPRHLELIGSTQAYLKLTAAVPLQVIASP